MNIALNKAHYPVTVLGPGRRIGLWLQGCSIHCPGCISKDTWEFDAGRQMKVGELVSWCKEVSKGKPDGITISGGEPFDQPAALAALLRGLIRWRDKAGLEFDVLCYSGHPLATLEKRHGALLKLLDAVIPEPYVDSLPMTHLWRGSMNQGLVPLSARGKVRYGEFIDAPAAAFGKRIQVGVDGNKVWYVGLPARGDMAALKDLCRSRGLEFGATSWGSQPAQAPDTTLPPLQGEGWGGDGASAQENSGAEQVHPHPPPSLPLEGGGMRQPALPSSGGLDP